ncbi:MAG: CBS domain-containing protein [bacterium]|nr:CBS domain-containing protein [bacterium]
MRTLASLLLAIIFLKCLLLYKTTRALPLAELRRRARVSHSKRTQALYKLLAFQTSFKIVILVLGGISGAIIFVAAANVGVWLCTLLLLAVTWLVLDDQFVVKPGGWLWAVSSYVAQVVLPIVNFLQPLLGRISAIIGHPKIHSGIYEREDLLELLDRQKNQIDNRLSNRDLKAARGALTFGDKMVGSVMTPRKAVVWVSADDSIGPKLMDNLHKTGYVRFPIITGNSKPSNPEAVGTLYLADLLKNLEKSGTVRDIMKRDAHFINESHNLEQALDGFLKSGQHLLVVVNNFEEVVGMLTLEDVLGQILGEKISDEFDRYHDKRAVAGHDPQK